MRYENVYSTYLNDPCKYNYRRCYSAQTSFTFVARKFGETLPYIFYFYGVFDN